MDRKTFNLLIIAIATLIICAGFTDVNAQIYSGQATAVRATVNTPLLPVLTTAVADSGRLPSAGGNITLASTAVNIPSVLSVGDSTISTNGSAGVTTSAANVNLLNIGVLSNTISATVIGSNAQASCPAGTASGNATITNLQINGLPVSVSGSPNQTITVFLLGNPVGTLTINEQTNTPSGITVNALHLRVTDPLDLTETNVIVASSHAAIQCASIPAQNRFGGRGSGVQLRQHAVLSTDITNIISDTGNLPRQGSAPIVTSTAGAGVSPLLSTGVVTSTTQGGTQGGNLHQTSSSSQVNNLGINALNVVTIGANVLNSNTQCVCSVGVPSCSGGSGVTSLAVTALGLPVTINVTGAPNQIVSLPLGLGTIVINEQISAGINDISVNALRINLNVAGLAETDVIVAASHSDIACATPPSSAEVSVGGRVTDGAGRAIQGATVRLTGQTGQPRNVITNPFGYYNFSSVNAGETYFVEASKKGISFSPRVVVPSDDVTDLDFTPQGGRAFK